MPVPAAAALLQVQVEVVAAQFAVLLAALAAFAHRRLAVAGRTALLPAAV